MTYNNVITNEEEKELLAQKIIEFLENARVAITEIGTVKEDSTGKMVTKGIRIYGEKSKTSILKRIDVVEEKKESMFKYMSDEAILEILQNYVGDTEEGEKYVNQLKKLLRKEIVLLPFKPNTACEADLTYELKGKELVKAARAEIMCVIWNEVEGQMKYDVIIWSRLADIKQRVSIKEYWKGFKILDLERMNKRELKYGVIEFNEWGYIQPIEIVGKNQTLIIDNVGVYICDKGKKDIRRVGNIGDKPEEYIKEIKEKEVAKVLETSLDYIQRHSGYIVPYGISETTKIRI